MTKDKNKKPEQAPETQEQKADPKSPHQPGEGGHRQQVVGQLCGLVEEELRLERLQGRGELEQEGHKARQDCHRQGAPLEKPLVLPRKSRRIPELISHMRPSRQCG